MSGSTLDKNIQTIGMKLREMVMSLGRRAAGVLAWPGFVGRSWRHGEEQLTLCTVQTAETSELLVVTSSPLERSARIPAGQPWPAPSDEGQLQPITATAVLHMHGMSLIKVLVWA